MGYVFPRRSTYFLNVKFKLGYQVGSPAPRQCSFQGCLVLLLSCRLSMELCYYYMNQIRACKMHCECEMKLKVFLQMKRKRGKERGNGRKKRKNGTCQKSVLGLFSCANGLHQLGEILSFNSCSFCYITNDSSLPVLSLVNQIYSWFSRISSFSKERIATVQQVMLNSFSPISLSPLSFHRPCSSGLASSEIVEKTGRKK